MSKQSLRDRLGEEARALPSRSHGWFRTWFRKVWDLRGGGLYACGFAITFLVLEIGSLFEDVANAGMIFEGQVFQFAIDVVVDSFKNTIAAFMWPVKIVQLGQPWGPIALGLAFWLFPIFVKPHIEKWMFADDPLESEDEPDDAQQ